MMKKPSFKHIILAVIFAIGGLLPAFLGCLTPSKIAAVRAEDTSVNQSVEDLKAEATTYFNYLSISQSGVSVSANDFSQLTDLSLYENIANSGSPEFNDVKHNVNALYLVGAFSINYVPLTDPNAKTLVIETTAYSFDNTTGKIKELSDNDNNTIITATPNSNSPNVTKKDGTAIDYTPGSPIFGASATKQNQFFRIKYTYTYTYIDSNRLPREGTKAAAFYIFQFPTLKTDSIGFDWKSVKGSDTSNIIYPGENQVYSDQVRLTIPLANLNLFEGAKNFYVDFWHNGKGYALAIKLTSGDIKIYNNYYSAALDYFKGLSGKEETELLNDATIAGYLQNDITDKVQYDSTAKTLTLTFSASGEYKVRLYDDSYTGSKPTDLNDIVDTGLNARSNMQEFNFIVKNTTIFGGFYFTAVSVSPRRVNGVEDTLHPIKNYLVSDGFYTSTSTAKPSEQRQRVNRSVQLNFYNVDSAHVKSIYTRNYFIPEKGDSGTSGSVLRGEATYYTNTNTSAAKNFSVLITDEASHDIYIDLIDNLSVPATQKTLMLPFQILKGIRSLYTYNNTEYPLKTDNITYNIVKTYEFGQDYLSNASNPTGITYGGLGNTTASDFGLLGFVGSRFNLYIANSSPTISGIENGKRTNGAVNLTLTGVATDEVGLKIRVTRDGNTILSTTIYNQNITNALNYNLSYSDLGSYRVELVDAMNNTTTLSFKITQQQNAAGIILIVVGCALGITFVVLIIRARSKITVR